MDYIILIFLYKLKISMVNSSIQRVPLTQIDYSFLQKK